MLKAEEYEKIEEKGLLFPSESMIMAGILEWEIEEPQPSMQISKIQATPTVVLLHCGCISLIPFIEFMNLEFETTHQVQMC